MNANFPRVAIATGLATPLLAGALVLAPGAERAVAGPSPAPAVCPSEVDGLDLTRATIPSSAPHSTPGRRPPARSPRAIWRESRR